MPVWHLIILASVKLLSLALYCDLPILKQSFCLAYLVKGLHTFSLFLVLKYDMFPVLTPMSQQFSVIPISPLLLSSTLPLPVPSNYDVDFSTDDYVQNKNDTPLIERKQIFKMK